LINRGGQGSVYLGYDARLQRRVAIKIRSLPAGRTQRKRLLHEARLVASIHSPKVVQIHDVIFSSAHMALVMEYVPGCDLEEFLAEQLPALSSVLTIGADIAGALAAARLQHIVHGDLKAANVLISESGRVKLTDFGIARSSEAGSVDHTTAGSLSALSPEQYLGRALDVRSDLFALGCLLYRMLTGEHPFVRAGRLDTQLLLRGNPGLAQNLLANAPTIPKELASLVAQLLQSDPRARPENTQQVRQQLRSIAREVPLAASDSLLQQARPCFRHESPADIPIDIPDDLGREGRSRLEEGGIAASDFGHRLALLGWPARLAAAVVLAAVVALLVMIGLRDTGREVLIGQPSLQVASDLDLPSEISAAWLLRQVQQALTEGVDGIQVVVAGEEAAARVLNASAVQAGPYAYDERLQVQLRCVDSLCVITLTRDFAAQQRQEQAVLLRGMPIGQWRDSLRGAATALYR